MGCGVAGRGRGVPEAPAPATALLSAVIVGSGFAGIGMAIRLKPAGIRDFLLLEREAGIGGTWRDNTYPGAACDVPSVLYSFSFEPGFHFPRFYACQADIRATSGTARASTGSSRTCA